MNARSSWAGLHGSFRAGSVACVRRSAPLLALCLLAACPPPPGRPDAAEVTDAGAPDAGRQRHDAGVPDAGLSHVALEDWCLTRAQAECERDVRCLKLKPARVSECVQRSTQACAQAALTRSVREGRQRFLSAAAVTCLNAWSEGSCTDSSPACDAVFTGLVPPDGGCAMAEECDPTGFCLTSDGSCPHRCLGWVPLGSHCDGSRLRCEPRSARCVPGDAGLPFCQALPLEGQGCVDGCAAGLVCLAATCVQRVVGPGEPCGTSAGAPSCHPEYFCSQDLSQTPPSPGTCERRVGLGGACTRSRDCLPTLHCTTVATTGSCQARSTVDEPCSAVEDCEDGLFCAASTASCRPLPADGGDCSYAGTDDHCAPGSYCDWLGGNACRPRFPAGASCLWASQCLEGDCSSGTLPDGGVGARCTAPCALRADGGF